MSDGWGFYGRTRELATLQKAMPKAEEAISYAVPAYKMHGKDVLFFAGCGGAREVRDQQGHDSLSAR